MEPKVQQVIEEVLRNRVVFIGDNQQIYIGYPVELIKELCTALASHAPSEAITAESLAQQFHETYERLAPQFGYETRKESAKPWSEVPEKNKRLMIAVCRELASEAAAQPTQWMKLPPNSDYPGYKGLHKHDHWCEKVGCKPACKAEIEAAQPTHRYQHNGTFQGGCMCGEPRNAVCHGEAEIEHNDH